MPADSAVWMRSDLSAKCALANQPHALAAIYYEKADTTKTPTTTATPYDDSKCGNDPLESTIPYFPFPATSNPAVTQNIDITLGPNKTGNFVWFMNGESFRANYDHPLLILANQGNFSYPYDPQWNVYNFGTNSSVRLVVRNLVGAAHPMHLHGHNFNVLAEGVGAGMAVSPISGIRNAAMCSCCSREAPMRRGILYCSIILIIRVFGRSIAILLGMLVVGCILILWSRRGRSSRGFYRRRWGRLVVIGRLIVGMMLLMRLILGCRISVRGYGSRGRD
eukprot:GHVO01031106.1.p1 GENE.GHVO01031106.1~~GHVO01031106.1.p1  ORF type:complete len:278 (+),score=15.06 GHVO01031106.1:95-928(+)